MITLEDSVLKFLIITNQYWCSGTDLKVVKRDASRNGNFVPKEKRRYRAFLVHHDTKISEMGDIEFPNELAAETAIDLGEV